MSSEQAAELRTKIMQRQVLRGAYATDSRTADQPREHRELYEELALELEDAKYANFNSEARFMLMVPGTAAVNFRFEFNVVDDRR